ncbi:auxin-responsive protein SAUR71-like [Curcuma longa]|uniref:auxin-responsive protein SAUR71-like n=1 Tax=Curcuma longa TaxID=136217 RepID=UPI003D9E7957
MLRRPSKVADSSAPNVRESPRRRSRTPPQGHVPVRVGDEMERYEVRADLLSRQPFLDLLHLSAAEFGYGQRGVLRIPCPVPLFRRLLAASADVAAEEVYLLRSFDGLLLDPAATDQRHSDRQCK